MVLNFSDTPRQIRSWRPSIIWCQTSILLGLVWKSQWVCSHMLRSPDTFISLSQNCWPCPRAHAKLDVHRGMDHSVCPSARCLLLSCACYFQLRFCVSTVVWPFCMSPSVLWHFGSMMLDPVLASSYVRGFCLQSSSWMSLPAYASIDIWNPFSSASR